MLGIDDETLQDLWDEENKMTEFKFNPPVEVKTGVEYEVKTCINCKEPTVKECGCECHKTNRYHIDERCKCNPYKPTDKSEKIEEIISELNKRFWNRDSKIYHEASDTREILVDTKFLESWLRDRLKQL